MADDEEEKRHRHVTLIHFEIPSDNTFHVTWEWTLKPPARKGNRADVMFVVNGVPVCIVEHKNPKDGGAIERAITQLRRYEKETPDTAKNFVGLATGTKAWADPVTHKPVKRPLYDNITFHRVIPGEVIQAGDPTGKGTHGLYVSRDSRFLYVSNRGEGTISLIDFKTRKVATKWVLPGGGSPDMGGVSADGKVLWLSGRYNSEVYAIDAGDGHLLARIPVGHGPHGLCVYPQPGRYSLGHTGTFR